MKIEECHMSLKKFENLRLAQLFFIVAIVISGVFAIILKLILKVSVYFSTILVENIIEHVDSAHLNRFKILL